MPEGSLDGAGHKDPPALSIRDALGMTERLACRIEQPCLDRCSKVLEEVPLRKRLPLHIEIEGERWARWVNEAVGEVDWLVQPYGWKEHQVARILGEKTAVVDLDVATEVMPRDNEKGKATKRNEAREAHKKLSPSSSNGHSCVSYPAG